MNAAVANARRSARCTLVKPDRSARRRVGMMANFNDVTRSPLPDAERVVESTIGTMDDPLRSLIDVLAPGLGHGLAATVITQIIAISVILVGGHVVSWLIARWCRSAEARAPRKKKSVLLSVMLNILKPLSIAVPYLGYMVAFMRALTGLDNIHHHCLANRALYPHWADALLHHALQVTAPVSAVVAKVIIVVILASLSWTMMLIKDELFNAAVTHLSNNSGKSEAQDIQRVMVPFNSLASWLIVAGCCVVCLMVFGFNPQPLLAVGSVSGIIIGFASQEILLNLFSGITMFITHPFVVGDLVELRAQMTWLTKATVVKIFPLRTMFLTEDNQIMTLPNRMVMDATVINHNQTFASSYVSEELATARQRLFKMEFALDLPPDPSMYGEHAQAVIQAILVRLSTMKGLRKDSLAGYISDYENGKFVICITAVGDSSQERPFEQMQQNFILNCYNGRFTGAPRTTARNVAHQGTASGAQAMAAS